MHKNLCKRERKHKVTCNEFKCNEFEMGTFYKNLIKNKELKIKTLLKNLK